MVVAVLFGLLILLLAVPLDVRFHLQRVEKVDGHVAIGWLFGLVRFRIPVPGRREARAKTERKPKKKSGKRKKRSGASNVLAVLRQPAFRRRVFRFLRDLLRAARARDFSLRMRLGLGDPADTGRLWALLGPVNALARNLRNADIFIEPEFVDPAFQFESRGQLRLFPLQFLAIALGFVLSRPTIRAWRTLRRQHA